MDLGGGSCDEDNLLYVLDGVGEDVCGLSRRQVSQRTPPAVEVFHVAGAAFGDVGSDYGATSWPTHTQSHTSLQVQ